MTGKVTRHSEPQHATRELLETGNAKVQVVNSSGESSGVAASAFVVNTHESRAVLDNILQELKILNLHMSIMTDNHFQRKDIE